MQTTSITRPLAVLARILDTLVLRDFQLGWNIFQLLGNFAANRRSQFSTTRTEAFALRQFVNDNFSGKLFG